jgi:hypothetical protein
VKRTLNPNKRSLDAVEDLLATPTVESPRASSASARPKGATTFIIMNLPYANPIFHAMYERISHYTMQAANVPEVSLH